MHSSVENVKFFCRASRIPASVGISGNFQGVEYSLLCFSPHPPAIPYRSAPLQLTQTGQTSSKAYKIQNSHYNKRSGLIGIICDSSRNLWSRWVPLVVPTASIIHTLFNHSWMVTYEEKLFGDLLLFPYFYVLWLNCLCFGTVRVIWSTCKAV